VFLDGNDEYEEEEGADEERFATSGGRVPSIGYMSPILLLNCSFPFPFPRKN
jgi:hypothetical protein